MSRIASSLPAIRATIGHIPQRLKTLNIDVHRSRLEILRRLVTRLVREERFELPFNRAVEARQYMERLLQLGVHRGEQDAYVNEMVQWWLLESDLQTKFFQVVVPRFASLPGPYTALHRLPNERVESFVRRKRVLYRNVDVAVLELKDHPFPAVSPIPDEHNNNVMNVLLKQALVKTVV